MPAGATQPLWANHYLAPEPTSTMGIVRHMIFKSSHSDQLSIYFEIEPDPVPEVGDIVPAAHLPEARKPGLDAQPAAVRHVVKSLNFVHRQRPGPTRLISPRKTL